MDIQKFIKEDLEIRLIVDENGMLKLNLGDVAKGLGFTETIWNNTLKQDVVKIHTRNVKKYLKDVGFENDFENHPINEQYIEEWVFYMLCIKGKNEKAREFQKWICKEVLPSLRKNNYYIDKENISSEQFESLQREVIDLTQQKDNFKNILVNNKRKRQKLKTFLEDMFPNVDNIYSQFLCNMYDKGTLDENFMPTEKFIKQNELKNMFIHITKTNKEITHDLILTNIGMAELSQRLYVEDNELKIKNIYIE